MDIGTAILGGSSVFSLFTGATIVILKFLSSSKNGNGNGNGKNDDGCQDPDCKGLLASTAVIASRNTEDIAEINKTFKEEIFPTFKEQAKGIDYITGKIDQALKKEDKRQDETGQFLRTEIKKIFEKTYGAKIPED